MINRKSEVLLDVVRYGTVNIHVLRSKNSSDFNVSNMVTFIRLIPLFNYNVVKARSLTQGITKQSGKFVHLSPTQPKIVTSPVRYSKWMKTTET